MRREERQAAMFKFGKMTKAKPFFPSLNTRGFLQTEPVTSVDKGAEYFDSRTRESLLFPSRVKDWSKKFAMTKTGDGSYFTKPVGREID